MKQLIIEIDEDLHTKIKSYCANNKTSIKEVTTKFYEELLKKNGSKRN